MEEVKINILNSLVSDSRMARKILASNIGISESALSKHVQQLFEIEGIIENFTVNIDYEKIGYVANAITLIKLSETSTLEMHELLEDISKNKNSIEVFVTFGDWDIYVRWLCKSTSQIIDSIEMIKDNKKVVDTLTIDLSKKIKKKNGPEIK